MTITLWGAGTSRTLRPHWALAELGVEYVSKPIGPRTGETQAAEFRALNTKEKVPVLVDGDLVLTESAAIVTYLGDRFGRLGRGQRGTTPGLVSSAALTPEPGTVARARYNEWLSYILMELDAHTLYVMRKHGDLKHLYGEAPAAMDAARAGFEKQLRWARPRVEAADHLVGDAFTGVDILMTTCLDWAVAYGFELPEPFLGYRSRQHHRVGFKKAVQANSAVG
ncbi:MAG: glutathione S-transferase family protein [Pseudomonadales bacterium]|nr:glutathione S-transferase family protein [Pseudomonadales bacterium]